MKIDKEGTIGALDIDTNEIKYYDEVEIEKVPQKTAKQEGSPSEEKKSNSYRINVSASGNIKNTLDSDQEQEKIQSG